MSAIEVITQGADQSQVYPLTELRRLSTTKDLETHSGQEVSSGHAIEQETPTPVLKLLVAGYSFFCAGVNDGTLGPLIPYFLSSFKINTGEVAIVYATTFAGWILSAVLNPVLTVQLTLGQLLTVGAICQLIAQALRPWSPLSVFTISFFFQSLGQAFQDAHSNTFVSSLKNVPHRWLGFIHACYALGLFLGPLIATPIANTPNPSSVIEGWRRVYFVLIAIFVVNIVGVMIAFRDTVFSRLHARGTARGQKRDRGALIDMAKLFKSKTVWLLSLYYFFALGAAGTAAGWVVEFLTTVRGGKLSSIGYVPTGYYGGLLAGRALLPEPTFRFGEQRMILLYCVFCVALQLVFWLQPNIIGSAVALSFMGFFSGPFFATVSHSDSEPTQLQMNF
ncbi:major facilitator superfamily domain-containing protein [Xylariaceae sp. FL0255]|nr:major facilitator superfamily domain-containing protein [Xylariaceae sp. FL0255]